MFVKSAFITVMRSERHFVVEDERGERIVVFRMTFDIASSESDLRRIAVEHDRDSHCQYGRALSS
jgi:hypothetical protein